MAKFKPYKLLESQLGSLPIKEGQLILTTDTKKLFCDISADDRIGISSDLIADLSVDGRIITYTRLDGTTGTITTQDSNTTYEVVTTLADGLMSIADKQKLDGIEAGAQKNTITGVKGSSENTYRTGNVNITKANIGLENVENKNSATIRGEITSDNVTTALGYTPLNSNLKGANSGLAELDENGKIPSSQLPSYVDDVSEYDTKANFPTTGEAGKIYVDLSTNLTYRWSGSAYAEISPSIALGTTSSTAFRGDYGNTAYTHATAKGSAFAAGLYKITTNAQGHVTAATAVAKTDITNLGIPAQDTTYSAATEAKDGLMSSTDKAIVDNLYARIAGYAVTGGTTSAYTASIDGVELTHGTTIVLRFNANNAANATLNLNGLGAKPIYYKGTAVGASRCPANAVMMLVYDTTQVTTGAWHTIYSYDANSTYSNAGLGTGYGTCTTAAATVAKVVSLSSYALSTGGIVSVNFTYAVPANATMNINNKGAKAIHYRGSAITGGIIETGDTATFIYDGSKYHLIAIDKKIVDATTSVSGLMSSTDKTKLDTITAGTTAPKANGTATVGTSTAYAREDHIHPLQTTVSGNAGTATKLQTARKIILSGAVTGEGSFDGSDNVTITTTIAEQGGAIFAKTSANVTTIEEIPENTDYTIPIPYTVGNNSLDVYYMGEKLIKDYNYIEIGTAGEQSTTIQLYNWEMNVPANRTFEFVVWGDVIDFESAANALLDEINGEVV